MEPYEVRVARAERELKKILPSPDFVKGIDPHIMADIVRDASSVMKKYDVRAEDLIIYPHPGEIFLDWVRHVFRPNLATHVDPEDYIKAVHALYNALSPLLRDDHREKFKRIIAEHLAHNPLTFDTDADHYRKIFELAKRYPVVDTEHLKRMLFYIHRDAARDHALNGNYDAALEHLGFLAALLDRDAIERFDTENPMILPSTAPNILRFHDLAKWVLREAEVQNLHSNPDLAEYYHALSKLLR